ncbi:MAG: DNA-binding protein [Methanosarcinales archaeon]|nr:MAG: DNA-binding protein [Methanosarcinales archaeon]
MDLKRLHQGNSNYPSALKKYLGDRAPAVIVARGNLDILDYKTLAMFCSVKCPGSLILQTYDFAKRLRHSDVTVVGGFHSPMERECLSILLRGAQSIVICPARGIEGMRMRAEYKQPLEQGLLLFLSPFTEKQRRITEETSMARNRFVAALADIIFVAHAEPDSKTEQFCREVLAWGKPIYTLNSEANKNLIAFGAKPITTDSVSDWS